VKVSEIEAACVEAAGAPHDDLFVPATGARRQIDLGRDVHALLGLVFDRTDLNAAAVHLRGCIARRRKCVLSTPNVNYVVAAMHDSGFRGTVLRSDYSVVDGFPIVQAARWMGIGLPGRVSGSDLFLRLQALDPTPEQPPVKLFLLGGPPGIASQAAERLNARRCGFECVGHDGGGFGSVESMSTPALLKRINDSGAEFVLVALGARKGQGWVDRNHGHVTAQVLSHLGAVINFAAGSVKRAPHWIQRVGLEWVWRVIQEPQLWRRYWTDGIVLVHAIATQLLPWTLRRLTGRTPAGAGYPALFEVHQQADAGGVVIRLVGDWRRESALQPLRHTLAAALRGGRTVQFDLSASPAVGSALLGLVALIDAWQVSPRALRASTVSDAHLHKDLHAHGMRYLLD
jgi:N-acetylglucosaminyldiphosphoundecaprenol N-acetyl-beta-D-mannosaminyltransferase